MTSVSARLNALSSGEARRTLLACCGSTAWVEAMLADRPFKGDEALWEAADRRWWALEPEDWREAFSRHPRIGERTLDASTRSGAWSREEQSGVGGAPEDVRAALEEGNRVYEERFGHVFLIRAAGRSAEEMLGELRRRLTNDPETELREAAREQLEITKLRLRGLASEDAWFGREP